MSCIFINYFYTFSMKTLTPKFRDIKILQGLLGKNSKKQISSLIYEELWQDYSSLTPQEKVFFIEKIIEKWSLELAIGSAGMKNIEALEKRIAIVLLYMEKRGVNFDTQKMQALGSVIREKIQEIETLIFGIIWDSINLNSPKQLQVLFFEKLGIKPIKKNKTWYSVDTDVLEEISKTHVVAKYILEYRSLTKLLSTYVEGLLKSVNSHDGRIHTTYDSLWTVTGRMSSNDPNLQNIPSGEWFSKDIKSCFIASPGNILVVADYSQIELRILAFLSQDEALLEAFNSWEDIHARTARFLFWEDHVITSSERRIAKSVNFWVIYGITGFGLAKTLGCSPWEAQKYVESFYEKYPKVREYYDAILQSGREHWYVETFFGRKRYIPSLQDANKTIRSIAEREAMNMPIQWTAADILKLAMVRIEEEFHAHGLQSTMILQVHDELVFDVVPSEKEQVYSIVRESMEHILEYQDIVAVPTEYTRVPLRVEIGEGENWGAAK